jgi:hypothetical protein
VFNAESYDHTRRVKLTRAGENVEVAVLSQRVDFSPSGSVKNAFAEANYPFQARWDRNIIFNDPIPEQTTDSELVRDFSSLYELRDCAVDQSQNRILAVHAVENSVWIYGAESNSKKIGELQLTVPGSLSGPEGIAVDSEGQVWIADWGNHRVLKVDSNGEWLQSFGGFGTNDAAGEQVKFTFPTRVAILEDLVGTQIGETTYYREDYLIVADHMGIHVSDMRGNYLHTALNLGESVRPGSLYGFRISGHGDSSRLHLLSRDQEREGDIVEFIPD